MQMDITDTASCESKCDRLCLQKWKLKLTNLNQHTGSLTLLPAHLALKS